MTCKQQGLAGALFVMCTHSPLRRSRHPSQEAIPPSTQLRTLLTQAFPPLHLEPTTCRQVPPHKPARGRGSPANLPCLAELGCMLSVLG
jgi:hypothetical protein